MLELDEDIKETHRLMLQAAIQEPKLSTALNERNKQTITWISHILQTRWEKVSRADSNLLAAVLTALLTEAINRYIAAETPYLP